VTEQWVWVCEDGHTTVTDTEEGRPRACTYTRRGYVYRSAPDALTVPPACDRPLRAVKPQPSGWDGQED
jgi:hypothetical protein